VERRISMPAKKGKKPKKKVTSRKVKKYGKYDKLQG
jgi:hypothetical protein